MNGERILCCITGQQFVGTPEEAEAAGWEFDTDGWVAPSPGWMRWPRVPRDPISREHVAYEGGIDFEPAPLNFND